MKFLWKYLKKYRWMILGGMGLKLAGTLVELLIPYVMEHLLDHVVPEKETVKKPGLLKRIFGNKKVRIGLGATAALVGVTIAGKVLKGIAAGHCGCQSGDQYDYEDPEEEKDDSEEDED